MNIRAPLLIIVLTLAAGCTSADPSTAGSGTPLEEADTGEGDTLYGVSFSPAAFTGDGITSFFQEAATLGGVVTWGGSWDAVADENGAPHVVAQLAPQYGLEPVIITDIGPDAFGNATRREARKQAAVAFAERYTPRFMGIGNEINLYHEDDPALFQERAAYYNDVYRAVKAASPETTVFTVFQYERLQGMHGGLFGGENTETADWQLLDAVAPFDMVAFTTYPGLVYRDPDDIPAAYYTTITAYTDRPFGFTELGWFRTGPAGWESSVAEQAAFIDTFTTRTATLNPQFNVWLFLHEQSVQEPFTTMTLYYANGTRTLAWTAWRAAGQQR